MVAQGTTLAGRYRLDARIGAGGMGEVWRGEDVVLARTVAVKVLLPVHTDDPGFMTRFRNEARAMATINHPGVVDVYDYGVDQVPGAGAQTYLVMKFVDGEPLDRLLARLGRIPPEAAMELIAQAASALSAVHAQGIVHRDIKPGNLLVRADGTLVLTDFGIARADTASRLTDVGMVLGTAAYCAPEQAEGAPVTPAVDIYALGVVAYECLAGNRPFDGDTPVTIALKHIREAPPPLPADIPAPVRRLVEQALSKDPARRFRDAAAMSEAARQAALGVPDDVRGAHGPPAVPAEPTGPYHDHYPAETGGYQEVAPYGPPSTGARLPVPADVPGAPQTAASAAQAPLGHDGPPGPPTVASGGRRRAAPAKRRVGLLSTSVVAAVLCVGGVSFALADFGSPETPKQNVVSAGAEEGTEPTKDPLASPTNTIKPRPTKDEREARAVEPAEEPTPETTPTPTVSSSPSPSPVKTPTPTPSPTPRPKKAVPDVGGLTLAQARPMIKAAGFRVQAELNGGGQVLACHTVVYQEPAAGEKLELGKSMMILFDPENGCESPSPQPTPTPSLSKVPVGR
ncbi:serine/threonine protein kinase [Spongiactinospora rosea]|uniref:non-specific serine/threonine protein kinase n=1 Tax=Spongiactinospora rosea TaxID=2248750 RepID=A0A366LPR1_9ACTN|nr:serine/threonine-protein kinase [Spongiactinospora rosea]RBQ15389.1 serine/threonine protein kinase [Spongiactinospora rosea]